VGDETEAEKRFERRAGLTIAILAAVLAVNDLFGGKYGDDEILGTNEKANAFAWYQSKSQKEALDKHQLELLNGLVSAGVAPPSAFQKDLDELTADVARYEKEKKEILEGSAAVGPDGWALADDEGQKGRIVGANEWKARLAVLGDAGDRFDLGTLFLQLCLVVGAVALVLDDMKLKERFYAGLVSCGLVGTVFTVWALATAWFG
jgi:hypothetical protein